MGKSFLLSPGRGGGAIPAASLSRMVGVGSPCGFLCVTLQTATFLACLACSPACSCLWLCSRGIAESNITGYMAWLVAGSFLLPPEADTPVVFDHDVTFFGEYDRISIVDFFIGYGRIR